MSPSTTLCRSRNLLDLALSCISCTLYVTTKNISGIKTIQEKVNAWKGLYLNDVSVLNYRVRKSNSFLLRIRPCK